MKKVATYSPENTVSKETSAPGRQEAKSKKRKGREAKTQSDEGACRRRSEETKSQGGREASMWQRGKEDSRQRGAGASK